MPARKEMGNTSSPASGYRSPMADNKYASEQERADLSKRRGQAAAQITDPEAKRKFIAAQGDTEAANKGQLPVLDQKKLSEEAALKGFKKGTTHVPSDGKYKLHKGEAVLDKKTADHYRSALGALSGDEEGQETAPEKKVKEMRIRRAGKKGHIIEHHHTSPGHHPMEEHVTSNMKELMKHIQENMPDEAQEEAGEGEGASEPQGTPTAVPSVVASSLAGGQ